MLWALYWGVSVLLISSYLILCLYSTINFERSLLPWWMQERSSENNHLLSQYGVAWCDSVFHLILTLHGSSHTTNKVRLAISAAEQDGLFLNSVFSLWSFRNPWVYCGHIFGYCPGLNYSAFTVGTVLLSVLLDCLLLIPKELYTSLRVYRCREN